MEPFSEALFEGVEQQRYKTHPWILESIEQFDIEGKAVLEVGFGMGTDHLAMARRGGIMHGIDLTPRNLEITSMRFAAYGFESALTTDDAENLPYANDSFDFVYSFGVVHHTPSTEKSVSEIHRVLKPGGKCWITVYHKNSLFFWWTTYLWSHLIKGGHKACTLRQQLSLIEFPNDNPSMVIRLFKKHEFVRLFDCFSSATASVEHLLPIDIAVLSWFIPDPERPRAFLDWLGKRWGWYVIVEAQK
jgi:ubiquinone/menaquinone biosynthesis C-methylase UbiE